MASFRPFPYRKEGIGRNVYRSYGFGSRGYGVNDDISSRRSHFYPRRSHEHHSVGGPGCYGFSKLARGYDYAICDDCGHRRALIEAGRHCFEEAQEYICCEPRCYNYQDYWDHDGGYGGCRERDSQFYRGGSNAFGRGYGPFSGLQGRRSFLASYEIPGYPRRF